MSSRLTGPAFTLLLTLSFSAGANPQSLVFSSVVSPGTPKGRMTAMFKPINARDELRKMNGIKVFRPAGKEVDLWRDSMKPLWKEYELIIGKDVINAAYNS